MPTGDQRLLHGQRVTHPLSFLAGRGLAHRMIKQRQCVLAMIAGTGYKFLENAASLSSVRRAVPRCRDC
jgi:hypothetical protein